MIIFFLQELAKEISAVFHNRRTPYSLAEFTGGEQLLNSVPHDIVFLDIEMNGMDGMETAGKLRERGDKCKLIFLTAHKKYVFSAFDVEAAHYFTKPVDPKKLNCVLNRIVNNLEAEEQLFITVKKGSAWTRINYSDILYIEVFDRKLFMHTTQDTYEFYGKLEKLEHEMPDCFFRCHRSYIVNLTFVRHYDKTSILLENGITVLISKRKYREFCTYFLNFLKKGDI